MSEVFLALMHLHQDKRLGVALILCLAVTADDVQADVETRLRGKVFGNAELLSENEFQRSREGDRLERTDLDLRGELKWSGEQFGFEVAAEAISRLGVVDSYSASDGSRSLDLTKGIDKSRLDVRLDRLALSWRTDATSIALGRQAISWGNGIVFSPLDLFAPFAPIETDRDFKAGDDMLLMQHLFADGSDLQLLAVARRELDGDRSGAGASLGMKWRGQFAATEVNVVAGRHVRDQVFGGGLSYPLGDAVVRFDVLSTQLQQDGWKTSLVANMDYSLTLADKNLYVFAELFRNGFAGGHLDDLQSLPESLVVRLNRGEVFSLRRWTMAVGGTLEWSARTSQSLLVLFDPYDGSRVVQSALTFVPDDRQTFELGLTLTGGNRGDAFGAIPLRDDLRVTAGGSERVFFRYVVFW